MLRTDATINGPSKAIFNLLATDSARRDFVSAAHAWLSFRRPDCVSFSDLFQGGTAAAVLGAQCTATRNRERIRDLRTFEGDLSRG